MKEGNKMKPSEDPKLLETVKSMGEIYGRQFSLPAALMFLSDMDEYTGEQILTAMAKCRKEMRTFPSVSDVLSRIDDGHPGPEEAWAMVPKDENASVIWTEEIAESFGVIRHMIDDDPIAARMAFREVYSKTLSDARYQKKKPSWVASLGHDVQMRSQALQEAEQKNRLSHDQVAALLDQPVVKKQQQISGPIDETNLTALADILNKITKDANRRKTGVRFNQIMTDDEIESRKSQLRAQARRMDLDDA